MKHPPIDPADFVASGLVRLQKDVQGAIADFGATPLITYGDITTNKDVDVFAFRPPSNYRGPLTVRLQSAGLSLLAPHVSILDAKGRVLADAQAQSDMGDVVTLHLNTSDPSATYYIKVQGATSDMFGIGSYGVAVTFDQTSTASTSAIDAVLRGPYQTLSPNDINTLFLGGTNPLLNNDHGSDDSLIGPRLREELALRGGREYLHAHRHGLLSLPDGRRPRQ